MQVQPYLNFDGRCEEALDFYKKALNAEVTALSRFSDAPPSPMMPADKSKIMHASFRVGDATLMASDAQCKGAPQFQGFSLSFSADNEAQAERVFAALGDGGKVEMPLGKTFFAKSFGQVKDRFGISWMVIAM